MRSLDSLVFSSIWAGAIAPALMYAASAAQGLELPLAAAILGFCGTIVVYGVDRLRDLERDRETNPARAAFVARNRARLKALCGAAAVASAGAALWLPAATWWVCGLVLLPGLLHRRLKSSFFVKTLYVTFAWLAVSVGVPVTASGAALADAAPAAAVLGLAIAGNLVASNLSDFEVFGARSGVAAAMMLCLGGVLVALLGGDGTSLLWPIPGCQLLAIGGMLAPPDDPERYGLVVIDGALGLGAVASLLLAA